MQVLAVFGGAFTAAAVQSGDATYQLGLPEVFTFLFVMLGPLKLIGPFATQMRLAEPAARRALAIKSTVIATVALLLGGFAGRGLLAKWQISPAVLLLTAGLVFLLVALRMVLAQYDPDEAKSLGSDQPTPFRFAFPTIVTPYGMAAFILLLTYSQDPRRTVAIVLLLLWLMVLNLLAMLFARPILKALGVPLALLGAVLGVLQVALAIQLMLFGLKAAGVIS